MSKENMSDQKAEWYTPNAKLCRLVQAYPCMYDRSAPYYLKKEYVERAWANIAAEVNDSIGSCKERWRNIRTAFARSLNIYKTPNGPNRHKRYYLHDELQFLTKHITPSPPNVPIRILTPTELEENKTRISVDEPDDNCTFQITIDSSSPPPPVHTEDEQRRTPEPDYNELPSSPIAKRRKMNDAEDLFKEMAIIQHNRDPDSDFLKSLLPEMKAMNARQKIMFKGKIFRILEEVFDDAKDFPNKFEPLAVIDSPKSYETTGKKTPNMNAGITLTNRPNPSNGVTKTYGNQTSTKTYNLQVPTVTLTAQPEVNIKQEPTEAI